MNSPAETLPPIQYCPPGKRTYRRPPPLGERVQVDATTEKRISALQEARERESIMSVARAQPHRRGLDDADDKRAGEPLWLYCERKRVKPGLYAAGVEYGNVVRRYRAAIDAPATGLVTGPSEAGEQTDAQHAAAVDLAKQRREEADGVLRSVIDRAPSVMADLCCDMRSWRPNDEDLIFNCLYRLSLHFKTLDLGINGDKVC